MATKMKQRRVLLHFYHTEDDFYCLLTEAQWALAKQHRAYKVADILAAVTDYGELALPEPVFASRASVVAYVAKRNITVTHELSAQGY